MQEDAIYKVGIEGEEEVKAGLDGITKHVKKVSSDISGQFKSAGESMKNIGKDMSVKVTAPIVAGLGLAGKSAMDFESTMANMSTLISGDSTQAIAELEQGILDMSSSMPKSAGELGAAAYDVLSAGVQGSANQLKVLEASGKLATAGLGDTAGGVDIMTSAINAFGLDAGNADQIADVLFKTVKNGKCFAKGTKIMMADGTLKSVEDIKVGEQIMGDDSTPRNVLALGRGKEMMYKVTNRDGSEYIVNASHLLAVQTPYKKTTITAEEFYNSSNYVKRDYKGYKTEVNFPERNDTYEVDPRYLGIWLGDGHSACARVTTMDEQIIQYIHWYADELGLGVQVSEMENNNSDTFAISTLRDQKPISLTEKLRDIGVLNNKHIPEKYKLANEQVRYEVLAGLIDTDGWSEGNRQIGYVSKLEMLADDVQFLARSLGFFVSKRIKRVSGRNYYELRITGDIEKIPCLLRRKIEVDDCKHKNPLIGRIKVERLGVDNYYGFEIDGNHLFVLGDFTVTHNTTVDQMAQAFGATAPTLAAAGISLEDFSAATAALTTTGTPASQAQNQLRASVVALSKPTEDMKKLFDKMGKESMKQMVDEGMNMGEIFQEIEKAAGGNAETMIKAYGSVEAYNAAIGVGSGVNEAYVSTLDDMTEGANAVDEAFEKQKETAKSQMQLMQNEIQKVMITIGNEVLPILIDVLKEVQPIIVSLGQKFSELSPGVKKVIIIVGALIAAIGPIMMVLGPIISGIGTLIGVFTSMGAVLAVVKGAFIAIAGAISLPIVAIIAIVGALVYLQVKFNIFGKLLDLVKGWFTSLAKKFTEVGEDISEFASKAWDSIKGMVSNIGSAIGEFVVDLVLKFIEMHTKISETIAMWVMNIIFKVSEMINTFVAKIVAFVAQIIGFYANLAVSVVNKIVELRDGVINKVVEMVTTFVSKITELVSSVKSGLSGLYQIGVDAMQGFYDGIRNKLTEVVNLVKDKINAIKRKFKEALKMRSPSKVMEQYGQWTGEGFKIGLDKSIDKVDPIMNRLPNQMAGGVTNNTRNNLDININIKGAGDGVNGLAEKIRNEIENIFIDVNRGI